MSLWSVLFRIALCVALILNGSVPVLAATHAKTIPAGISVLNDHHKVSPLLAAPAMAAHHGCHEGITAKATQPERRTVPAKVSLFADTAEHADSCCAVGKCAGSCTQHCAASITSTLQPRITYVPTQESMSLKRKHHRAPRLPDLIRPPIA